ncbi:MAG TPA: SpoIIE family protein phosphatase, partial [Bacteroidota bacterium]|nr:SpoIIE family protein phosphatase [Bacteroidota bacterium]
ESLPAKGIGLGLERGPLFESELEERCRPLLPDQTFLFYSDGLTEAMNSQNEEFGEDRIAQIISNAHNISAANVQQMIIAAIKQFQGTAEQHDDMTLVVVESYHHFGGSQFEFSRVNRKLCSGIYDLVVPQFGKFKKHFRQRPHL